ncbi:MAG: 4-hydroxy-tetrahydrodipicolinate reductase [Bdellovibrionales bacterium]|nr:4-hydroxy-tetrahydrodipicolinate reductase [Bdellovibrionales bacterium]
MSNSPKICLVGATGRMGREIARRAQVVCGIVESGASEESLEGFDFPIGTAFNDCCPTINIVVDFSTPTGTEKARAIATSLSVPLLVGTTGLDDAQRAALERDSSQIPVLVSGNFSLGINAMQLLVEQAVKLLPEADVEVLDIHHRAKVDAPSGTAFMLAQSALKGRGGESKSALITSRDDVKAARKPGEITLQSLRGGGVPGEHTVYLFSDSERIEITHRAGDRGIFADGAVKAASWLIGKSPGFYSMRDVLGA